MKRRVPSDPLALAAELARLSQLDLDELRERWKGMFGKIPSLEIGRSFLIRAIAYRLQEWAYRGLKPSTRRLLAEVAEETAAGNAPKAPQIRKAQSGTILVREWQGNAHRVTMLDDGVSFNGKHYRSLSEVAREITGSDRLAISDASASRPIAAARRFTIGPLDISRPSAQHPSSYLGPP